jgi:hypothetical protein
VNHDVTVASTAQDVAIENVMNFAITVRTFSMKTATSTGNSYTCNDRFLGQVCSHNIVTNSLRTNQGPYSLQGHGYTCSILAAKTQEDQMG